LQADLLHQADVFFPEPVMVIGDVAGVVVPDFAGCVCKAIPDGFAFAVFIPGAFDLVGGGCRAPQEIVWKDDFAGHVDSPFVLR
jgi:hypothetical protein